MEKNIQLFGTKELNDLFEQLKDSQQRSVYLSTFRKLANPAIKEMRSKIPSSLSGLRKSLITKPVRKQKALKIGTSRKKDKQAYLANIFEGGTKERFYITKKNKVKHNTGRVQPLNFFYDTLDDHAERMKTEFKEQFIESFKKMVERYNKKKKSIL